MELDEDSVVDTVFDWLWAHVPSRPMSDGELHSLARGLVINGPLTRVDVLRALSREAESRGRKL